MSAAYIAAGPDDGWCGHRHPTIAGAVGCLTGDRHLEAIEGAAQRPLTDPEFAAMLGELERRAPAGGENN